MFEEKDVGSEVQMIGTFVDVYEFADRWSRFSTFQKAVLRANSFVGTLDDFAIYLGYSAPMGTLYRKQIIELEEIDLVNVEDFDKDIYESRKKVFDYYDFEHSPKRKNVKMFFIPRPFELANKLLECNMDKLPDHSGTGPAKRKSVDRREECNQKRKELHQKNKK